MNKKILILGGGGFIGGHLGKYFKDRENFVRIIDLKKHEHFPENEICDDFVIADLRDHRKLTRAFYTDYDEVYQLASDVGGAGYIFAGDKDAQIVSNSALININVARQVIHGNIGKLFFSSSSCAYPIPDSDYGQEKLFSEIMYQAFRRNYGIDIKIGRFQNVYGTHDNINNRKERFMIAVCRKIAQANDGDSIEIWGDGTQKRSFIFIDDCIREIISLMDSDDNVPVNIGSERAMSINDIAMSIIDISGKQLNIENTYGEMFHVKYGFPCPVGAVTKYVPGFTKEISTEGLKRTYEWVNKIVHEN